MTATTMTTGEMKTWQDRFICITGKESYFKTSRLAQLQADLNTIYGAYGSMTDKHAEQLYDLVEEHY